MTFVNLVGSMPGAHSAPMVRRIGIADLTRALAKGFDDFKANPTHTVFIAIIYPIIGLFIARMTMGETLLPLAYPMAAGFALIGPFAATGIYELSRRREAGLDQTWQHAFDVFRSPSWGAIATLGAMQVVIFLAWLTVAQVIFVSLFGDYAPTSIGDLVHVALSTREGLMLIVIGNAVGFLFAVIALTLGVVSYPLLLDRPLGVMAAVDTSVRVVKRNPLTIAVWGLIVAALLLLGSLPFFVGLAVVLPVLGHATWHLYRAAVVQD